MGAFAEHDFRSKRLIGMVCTMELRTFFCTIGHHNLYTAKKNSEFSFWKIHCFLIYIKLLQLLLFAKNFINTSFT